MKTIASNYGAIYTMSNILQKWSHLITTKTWKITKLTLTDEKIEAQRNKITCTVTQ